MSSKEKKEVKPKIINGIQKQKNIHVLKLKNLDGSCKKIIEFQGKH